MPSMSQVSPIMNRPSRVLDSKVLRFSSLRLTPPDVAMAFLKPGPQVIVNFYLHMASNILLTEFPNRDSRLLQNLIGNPVTDDMSDAMVLEDPCLARESSE